MLEHKNNLMVNFLIRTARIVNYSPRFFEQIRLELLYILSARPRFDDLRYCYST